MPELNLLARSFLEGSPTWVAEGTLLVLFAWILLRLVRQPNSGTRFAVWFSVLVAIALLPFSLFLSRLPAGLAANRGAKLAALEPMFRIPSSWALWVFLVWAVIAGALLFRMGIGLWQIRKLRRDSRPLAVLAAEDEPPLSTNPARQLTPENREPEAGPAYTMGDAIEVNPRLCEILRQFRLRRVALCVSDTVRVPTAIGFFKPAVVVPAWLLRELSAAELNQVLLHELAHLRRWDDWTNLAQKVLRALFFFHPAVWWLDGKLSLEREMTCDDFVLAETANPRAYAQCLAVLAEKSFLRRSMALAQAAVSRLRQTSLRVSRILDMNRPAATRIWRPAVCLVALFAAACLISEKYTPEIVGVGGSASGSQLLAMGSRPDGPRLSAPVPRDVTLSERPVFYPSAPEPGMPGTPLLRVERPLFYGKRLGSIGVLRLRATKSGSHSAQHDRGIRPGAEAVSLRAENRQPAAVRAVRAAERQQPTAELVVIESWHYGVGYHDFSLIQMWRVIVFNSGGNPATKTTKSI